MLQQTKKTDQESLLLTKHTNLRPLDFGACSGTQTNDKRHGRQVETPLLWKDQVRRGDAQQLAWSHACVALHYHADAQARVPKRAEVHSDLFRH